MYCQKCGAFIENNQKFCQRCGNAVSGNPATARPAVNSPLINTAQPIKNTENKNKIVPIIIAAVAVLLVIVGVVLFFVFSGGSDKNNATKADREEETTVAQTEDAFADEYNDTTVGEIEMTTEPLVEPTPVTDFEYIKSKGTLVIGITDYMPMNYYDENGELIGFDTEFAEAVCAELGVEPVFKLIIWSERVDLLNKREIDCVWNGMPITEEIKTGASVSIPYMKNGQVLIVRKETAEENAYGMPEDACIVAVVDTTGEYVLETDEFFDGVKNFRASTKEAALREVVNGIASGFIFDYAEIAGLIGEGTDYPELVPVDCLIFNEEQYGIAFRKESDVTVKVNEIINKLAESGKLYEIAKKYGLESNLTVGSRQKLKTVTEGKLTVATNAEFAPFEYYDENGELAGVDIEIVEYIADELGLELEFKNMPYDDVVYSVYNGEADLAISAITPHETNRSYIDFTECYYTSNAYEQAFCDMYAIGYSKENKQLQTEVDAILLQMKNDGTLDRIIESYFD